MASHPKFLRNIKDGRMLGWSSSVAVKKEYEAHDPDTAKIRIASLKRKLRERTEGRKDGNISPEDLAKAQAIVAESKEIAVLESQLSEMDKDDIIIAEKALAESEGRAYKPEDGVERTEEEIAEAHKQEAFDSDKVLAEIKDMGKKSDVRDYLGIEFGVVPEDTVKLTELKELAVEKRKELITGAL